MPTVARWIPLHVLLVVLFACLALALYAELGDRRDTLATPARLALALFVVDNSAVSCSYSVA
ncbi:MAG: hypothetical protein M3069_19155 [Chloroflexota bacterium]|nr:hypothetical protein [Chloroflexota bacterium]